MIENMAHTEKITYFWTGLKHAASPQKKNKFIKRFPVKIDGMVT